MVIPAFFRDVDAANFGSDPVFAFKTEDEVSNMIFAPAPSASIVRSMTLRLSNNQ